MQNPHFGSKINIPKKHVKNPFYKSFRVVLCKKTAPKNTLYSRNETIFKIGHYAKAKAPGNRLLRHFQTALPMLPSDWAEKSFVLFCPSGEQQLLRYCGGFYKTPFASPYLFGWFTNILYLRETFILISLESGEISKWWLEWIVHQYTACSLGKFSFWYPDESILTTLFTEFKIDTSVMKDR